VHLWKYMRSGSQELRMAQNACLERYEQHRAEIRDSLNHGDTHPFVQLARLSPEKFFSDIIESLLGALFVDSNGNLDDCQTFVERIGLAAYARRIVTDNVNVVHPRAAFQHLVPSSRIDYVITPEADSRLVKCRLMVDGKEIMVVNGCFNKDAAMTLAADAALKAFPRWLATENE